MKLPSVVIESFESVLKGRVSTASREASEQLSHEASAAFAKDAVKISASAKKIFWRDGNALMQKTQMDLNREAGARREVFAERAMNRMFPKKEGFTVLPQAYLRDREGNILKDPVTDEARRVDFVVFRDRKITHSFEVTSFTASKEDQLGKELRIRQAGGNFILDPESNELVHFPARIKTQVWRTE